MKYKAYVFDIDGTILQNGEAAPNMALQNAINALQQNGAIIIIATGRALFSAKAVLGTIKPDYFISTNGAYITNKSDKMIFAQYMTSQEMYALVDFCDDYELPLSFTFNDGYYIYTETERYISEYGDNAECTEFMRDGTERVRHLIDMPYGACLCAKSGKADEFNAKYAHLALNLVPFGSNDYYDVFPNSVNKAISTQKLLNTLSLNLEDTIAFGDGYNDVELLRECGYGVAVGSPCSALADVASEIIKENALALYLCQSLKENI